MCLRILLEGWRNSNTYVLERAELDEEFCNWCYGLRRRWGVIILPEQNKTHSIPNVSKSVFHSHSCLSTNHPTMNFTYFLPTHSLAVSRRVDGRRLLGPASVIGDFKWVLAMKVSHHLTRRSPITRSITGWHQRAFKWENKSI